VKLLKSFGRFWYDFIIGDDWKIAVAVVAALAVVAGAMKAGAFGDHGLAVLGGVLVMLFFAISLVIDVRPRKKD
jgi:putative Ca2+/H+ antiporter (TMEM165/GDT1 family)